MLPSWYGIIRMAEKLSKFPWEIDRSVHPVIWYIRLQWFWNTEAAIQSKLHKKARHGRRG